MRFLVVLLIIHAVAFQLTAAVDTEELLDKILNKFIRYPLDLWKKTPVGFAVTKLGGLSLNKMFESLHNEEKNSKDKYPANENDVIFWCTNSKKKSDEVKLNDPKVKKKLNTSKPINFLIHGFMSGLDADYMNKTVRDWVKHGDCNVCAVDWSALAGKKVTDNLNYVTVATKYTKQVANAIHRFMEFLQKNGMNIRDVSIAGHSLGAHVSGLVGASFGGKVKAIYGKYGALLFEQLEFKSLDPAGPGFTKIDDRDIKLDKSDATYVQCINTDGNVFGTDKNYKNCHANFHVNDGDSQPGCLKSVEDYLTCDHARACDYFRESLDPKQKFRGIRMPMKDDIPINELVRTNEVDLMGIHTDRIRGNFSVYTNAQPPFALSKKAFLQKIENLRTEHPVIKFVKNNILN